MENKSLLPNIYEFISKTYPFSQLNDLEKDATATQISISYHSTGEELDNEALAGAGLYMIRTGVVEERNYIWSSKIKVLGEVKTLYDPKGFGLQWKEKEGNLVKVFTKEIDSALIP